ncbi:MAG: tetratricopeptide repeat protein [Bacteroidales bacterium]|nr:tetratricopeptide repeat protein [Candidatus Sodaliphilus fimicaballi]
MKQLLINSAFPSLKNDMTIAQAQISRNAAMPPTDGLAPDVVLDMHMTYALFLIMDHRTTQATQVVDDMIYNDEPYPTTPPLYNAWLWVARMTLLIGEEAWPLALGSAENALSQLASIPGKKSEDFMALLVAILYNLAMVHNAVGDNSRASKELTKAQQLLERLVKKNEARFSAMLLYAVEASTDIIQSRTKQMNVLAHYQTIIDTYTSMLAEGKECDTRRALTQLVDTLRQQGEIMLQMGNSRNAVKYYTKALRYQKKLNEPLGLRDLTLSIGLAKALMRLINRRAAAEQLLTSLLPLARKQGASNEVIEIENLLNNKTKNYNIMTLLKGIF